ncbi:hypothetical protein ACFPME_10915 [Rhodanobacter umsongensis]|uniref:Uncharacterized protein n=1 Tax=Rhodanobacter umsongensis TaxID=633153 RepID=A0ABW0JML0_9GAMM
MARLAIDQAPAASLPRRFLLSAPLWGMFAGALLLADGDALLRSRWHPAALALVHVFTLGVLGNVMFGSVLQFLPAAAGVRVRGGMLWGAPLHALFNLGALLLVAGLHQNWHAALLGAGVLLPLAFVLLAAMTLPGLLAAAGQRLLRAGLGVAIASGVLTALLGGALALALADGRAWPVIALVDVHACWGVLGWMVVLLASVARVVMPMFQGTATPPARWQALWLGSTLAMLCGTAWWRLTHADARWLADAVALHATLFACAALWLQSRVPRQRRNPLLGCWRAGLVVLLLAAFALVAGPRGGLLAGALGLGIALPLLLLGMSLEIIAFIDWIDLHRRCGRGVHLPGVQRLLPDSDKRGVLLAQLPLLLLPAAVLWPSAWLARGAGLALLLAWLGAWSALRGVRRRANGFLLTLEDRP